MFYPGGTVLLRLAVKGIRRRLCAPWPVFRAAGLESIFSQKTSMKHLALWAIRVYQRWISPRKGFCCAYRAHTGHASCSALGYRAIRRFGVAGGMGVLRSRMHKCGVAQRRYRPAPSLVWSRQAGFCDCECGPGPCTTEWPCGCGSEKKNKKQSDQDVVLPPRRAR